MKIKAPKISVKKSPCCGANTKRQLGEEMCTKCHRFSEPTPQERTVDFYPEPNFEEIAKEVKAWNRQEKVMLGSLALNLILILALCF